MFRYNPNTNYQPNGGRYLQILSGKDLYKQTIVVSARDTFPVRLPNIFVDYLLGEMKVGDKLWTNSWLTVSNQIVKSLSLPYKKFYFFNMVQRINLIFCKMVEIIEQNIFNHADYLFRS